ncbi:UNVERIFIED_CONTAM: Death-inducer obliterator 1 [Sesamum angustifolium]|uniref:Death-inducer obliterator 1 n=1 Tax=Sesamum angustifolium TaxID=2727405 RepID=A0AAW2KML4_9LAMI
MDVAGICDDEGNRKFELALARNSWKIRAEKLLGSAEKPTLQQIQHHLKEGLAMNIHPEDYFRQTLTKLRDMALQWADTAKKVSMDGGMLGLDRVFELISEGERLPISCEKELKLLRDRSMLYCICRRPYDQRAMVACDECDEWYHFDCIKISSAPKVYICPACSPFHSEDITAPTTQERFTGNKFEEPQTPLRRSELRRNSQKPKSSSNKTLMVTDMNDCLRNFSSSERLLWRNRKPFRRAARKRSELQSLSPFFHVQNK